MLAPETCGMSQPFETMWMKAGDWLRAKKRRNNTKCPLYYHQANQWGRGGSEQWGLERRHNPARNQLSGSVFGVMGWMGGGVGVHPLLDLSVFFSSQTLHIFPLTAKSVRLLLKWSVGHKPQSVFRERRKMPKIFWKSECDGQDPAGLQLGGTTRVKFLLEK